MAQIKLTCENCGFEEELSSAKLKERTEANGKLACSACGEELPLPDSAQAELEKGKASTQQVEQQNIAHSSAATATAADEAKSSSSNAAPQEKQIPTAHVYKEAGSGSPAQDPSTLGAEEATRADSLGNVKGKIKKTVRLGQENPLFAAERLDAIFHKIAQSAEERFDRVSLASVRIGHYVLLATAAIAVIAGALISLRSLSLAPLFTGISMSLLLLFAQYLATKGFELLDGYIEKNSSSMPGDTLPELISAFAVLGCLLAILGGIIISLLYYSPIWLGFAAVAAIGAYFAAAAFMSCQSRLNVNYVSSMPASEIAVELAAIAIKSAAALVPFIFGLGSAIMALCMIWPSVSMLLFNINNMNSRILSIHLCGLLACAFLPIIAYVNVIIWSFIIQLARSILNISKK